MPVAGQEYIFRKFSAFLLVSSDVFVIAEEMITVSPCRVFNPLDK